MYTSIVIHLLKERYENSKGILTIDKLNKALKYYKSKSDSDTAYVETRNFGVNGCRLCS
ncbi:hypothetical protein G8S49_05045 [Clostridium botulinum C]|uniref:Uncharacterized protein n=1 Tax=Clostridium botulinum C TaxID=36828 RepID=A0A9Q3V949_CLOBO|nr:hypothetical protein [Clostridium botulinum]MCD3194669.1 hypothetical protein [Clostridium botulinum C]MCD3200062.1 hypothetical protein [Clostridium botulinum C]MCD3205537.1 hypothetical protein [Clostridium botulinum C]MCD3208203.1 hypothetical protein [Clostridium botulinum C]MCD3224404.1 hypothetical protein [Clostridium botulinum C]